MSLRRPARSLSGLARATLVVVASSGTAMVVGLLKNVLAAYYFGTSGDMDAYLLALLLPDIAMQLARTGAFNFIPLFAAERQRSEEEAWKAAGRMLAFWLLLLLVALALAFVLSPPALDLLAPGFSGVRRQQTLAFTRVLFLMAGAVGLARLLALTLHAQRRFAAVGASEVVFQLASVGFLVTFHGWGITSLVWAQILGGFAQLLVVALALLGQRRLLRPVLDLRSALVRRTIRLTLPVYLGDSGDKINLMVTRAFASLLPAGGISALQYAFTLVEGVHGLLAGSFAVALFPYLSQRFARREQRGTRVSLHRATVFTVLAFLPMAAGVWLAAEPLVVVLFEHGSFDVESTAVTCSALRIFAPALLALGVNGLIGSTFHAHQDTKTPMQAGLLRVACNIVLCATLAPTMGVRGIALATTVALYVKLAFLLRSLRRVFPAGAVVLTLKEVARVLPALALMVAVVYPLAVLARAPQALEDYAAPLLVSLGVLGLSAYATGLWIFCRRELVFLVALVHHLVVRQAERRRAEAAA